MTNELKKELKKNGDKICKKIHHIPCYPQCSHFIKFVRQGLCRFCRCALYSDLVVCGNCGNKNLKAI